MMPIKPAVHSFIFLLFLFACVTLQAQNKGDIIYKKDGTTVAAKVLEITPTEIKYKKISNPDGPTYAILKSEAVKIVYANGEVENYSNNTAAANTPVAMSETPFDADNFLTFSGNGHYMITDLAFEDEKPYLCFWDIDSKLVKKIPFDNRREYQGVYNWQVVADNGSYLHKACLYDSLNKLLTTFINPKTKEPFGHAAKGNIISPDGRRILIKTTENVGKGPMYLFDSRGTLLKTIKVESFSGVGAWKFSHYNNYILASKPKNLSKKGVISVYDEDGNDVCQIDLEAGYEDYKYYPFNKYGYFGQKGFVDFSFDDKMIIAPSDEQNVALWDVKGNLVKTFPHFHAKVAAISRDGNTVVTVGGVPYGHEEKVNDKTYSGGQIKIWSVDGTLIKEIPFPVNPSSVEFTPSSSGLAVLVEGSPIWLWADQDYKLDDDVIKSLPDIAQKQEVARSAQRANEKRQRHAEWLSDIAKGLKKSGEISRKINAQNKLYRGTGTVKCKYYVSWWIENNDTKMIIEGVGTAAESTATIVQNTRTIGTTLWFDSYQKAANFKMEKATSASSKGYEVGYKYASTTATNCANK